MNNLLGILLSFVFIFAVLFLARYLERFGKEYSRKAVHILLCNWWLLAMAFFDHPLWAALVPACFVILNFLSYKYGLFSAMERGAGKEDLGTVYYALSLLILALISFGPLEFPVLGGVGILAMGYGDGLAAVVGKLLPVRQYRIFKSNRSVGGSTVMLAVTFITTALLLFFTGQDMIWQPALAVAAGATVLEAITPLGLDNLTVPLGASAIYWLMLI